MIRHHLGPISHILAGALPLAWSAVLRPARPHPGLILLVALFALLPDVDSAASHIGRIFPYLSQPIERRFGHRTVTHSALATGLVAALAWLLFRDGWLWLWLAYASHLVLDMMVGEQGVPLLWPGRWRFYLTQIRGGTAGETAITLVLAAGLLVPLLWPTGAATVAHIIPKPPTATPTPTPRPNQVAIRIPHVYDPDREILVRAGDNITVGQPLADLATYRALVATPAPLLPTPILPTPYSPDPLAVSLAEAELELARLRYQQAIATPTRDLIAIATLAPQATAWAQYIADRENTLWRERDNPASAVAWTARTELEQCAPAATAVAYRLAAELHPPGPDPLSVEIARSQLELARLRYQQAIVTPTPLLPTPILPTPTPLPTPAFDETRVASITAGRVVAVNIVSVTGNEATVEIIIQVESAIRRVEPVETSNLQSANVARIVDGDTIVVRIGERDETIRFIGVDTPETRDPNECYGREAATFTAALLPVGTPVRLELDAQERDRYGRLLAYVYLPDGRMVNEVLVAEGYAQVMTIPPNVRYADLLLADEQNARAQSRGLWSSCNP